MPAPLPEVGFLPWNLAKIIMIELEEGARGTGTRLGRNSPLLIAVDSMLKRWTAFTRFLADGRICLSNNAAERELRGIALGRKSRR